MGWCKISDKFATKNYHFVVQKVPTKYRSSEKKRIRFKKEPQNEFQLKIKQISLLVENI